MIRIDLTRQNINNPDHSKRHPSRASCEVDGQRYETAGPGLIYKLSTLLWLHGHGGEEYQVWDDRDPFGNPGGLALRGQARNWALLVKGKPNFTRKAKPDSDFIPDEREVIARAAGTVVDLAGVPAASGLPGAVCVTRRLDGPCQPGAIEGPSTGVDYARAPKAA